MICSYTLLGYLKETRGTQVQRLQLTMSNSSIASSHKGSLDTSIPLMSRFLLPICNLFSVVFPSSNGESWKPHTVGHLTV